MRDQRTEALRALRAAHETTNSADAYFELAVAQTYATLWLGELVADLTSAVRETGRK